MGQGPVLLQYDLILTNPHLQGLYVQTRRRGSSLEVSIWRGHGSTHSSFHAVYKCCLYLLVLSLSLSLFGLNYISAASIGKYLLERIRERWKESQQLKQKWAIVRVNQVKLGPLELCCHGSWRCPGSHMLPPRPVGSRAGALPPSLCSAPWRG